MSKFSFIPTLRVIAAPCKIMLFGGISLGVYLALISLILWISTSLGSSKITYQLLQLKQQFPQYSTLIDNALPWVKPLLWSLIAPFAIASTILPAKLLWLHERLPVKQLIFNTPKLTQLLIHTACLAMRPILYTLIPGLAMLFIYYAFALNLGEPLVQYVFAGLCVIVSLVVAIRALPYLFSPVIALCSHLAPEQAVYYAQAILGPKKRHLLALLAFCILSWLCLHSLLLVFKSFLMAGSSALPAIVIADYTLSLFCFWYLISGVSIITLNTIAQLIIRQNKPMPNSRPHMFKRFVNQNRPAEDTLVEVKRAWVNY